MSNEYFNDGRQQEVRYDPVGTDDRTSSLEPERHEKPPREGASHAAKLASLSILFSLVIVIGSLTYIVNMRQQTTTTQASNQNLFGPASVSEEDKALTASIMDYPTRYKDRAIPQNIIPEAEQKYVAIPEAERKAYIINRVVLYYIFADVLTVNNLPFTRPVSPLTFEGIEAALPTMTATMKSEYPQPEVFVNEYMGRFTFY